MIEARKPKPLHRRLALPVWGMTAAVLVAFLAAPAPAAVEQVRVVARLPVAPPPGVAEGSATGSMLIDESARRLYQVFPIQTGTRIRAIDLDTFERVREVDVPYTFAARGSAPAEFIHAIDTDTHTLYLAYLEAGFFAGVLPIDGRTLKVGAPLTRDGARDATRNVRPPRCEGIECEPPGVCTAASCGPQVAGALPALLAMDVVPTILTGRPPKLLLLWEEQNGPGADLNSNVMFLAQWDAQTGRQDWFYQVRACGNRKFPSPSLGQYATAVFQGRLYANQIYLVCAGPGGTGQAVRLTLNDLNQPNGTEEAFPGPPLGLTDVFADRDDDRLLMRVVVEEGEAWWVFNGGTGSYSGIVGVTLQPTSIGAGLDPLTGRLYLVAPSTQRGRQKNPGGFLMSDIRRNPTPQALAFPRFAATGYQRIVVDGQGATRRVFVRLASAKEILVFQDDVPISEDPSLTDLDRFTTDVEEKAGVTGRNFTATGHAWGVRASFVGGIEGTPPTGPDLSSIRLGRATPQMIGSPCGTGDRRFVVGTVRDAALSNNIASASATAGEVDPGTRTDSGQPTARCYPYPKGPGGADVLKPVFGENYPRPLDRDADEDGISDADERTGSDWPYGTAECQVDRAKDATETRPRPLERFEPEQRHGIPKEVPEEHRDAVRRIWSSSVPMEGFNAAVECRYAKGFTTASAEANAFEATGLPGGIGFVRVADVSSHVRLYLDPERGLVSRSVAYARGINIGNKVFIDAAYTVGEAWAAGRYGSADTRFERRLCGVRVGQQVLKFSTKGAEEHDVTIDQKPIVVGPPVGEVDVVNEDTDDVNIAGADVDGCGDPAGQALGQQPVIDAINRALGSRGRVTAPQPDGQLADGTPGGYLASIQKDRLQQISARAVNNDDSSQVPALEMVVFNNDPTEGRGRQIYQFAGVDASVTYGIFLLNPGEDLDDLEEVLVDVTGPPTLDTPVAPPPAEPDPAAPRQGPLTVLFQGMRLLLRSPRDALLAAAVWALLVSPFRLAARRRALRALA